MMTITQFTEQVNRLINAGLGGGLTAPNIEVALTSAVTNLQSAPPTLSHDRTIEDPGAAMNPSQP